MVNKENIRRWAEALESGQYQQARGKLARNGGFCCLGVACELYRRETGLGDWIELPNGSLAFADENFRDDAALPIPVALWLGLGEDADPYLESKWQGSHPATHWNDYAMRTFADIAEMIRRTYLENDNDQEEGQDSGPQAGNETS